MMTTTFIASDSRIKNWVNRIVRWGLRRPHPYVGQKLMFNGQTYTIIDYSPSKARITYKSDA
ncbi:MAG: hypothetical protein V3T23_00275 [Nitrososphaerales archaeon]